MFDSRLELLSETLWFGNWMKFLTTVTHRIVNKTAPLLGNLLSVCLSVLMTTSDGSIAGFADSKGCTWVSEPRSDCWGPLSFWSKSDSGPFVEWDQLNSVRSETSFPEIWLEIELEVSIWDDKPEIGEEAGSEWERMSGIRVPSRSLATESKGLVAEKIWKK